MSGRAGAGGYDGIDPVDGREVRVHRCRDCGRLIALDLTKKAVRNDYPGATEADGTGAREPIRTNKDPSGPDRTGALI